MLWRSYISIAKPVEWLSKEKSLKLKYRVDINYNNKTFHEEDFDPILERAEFDVKEIMNSSSLIEDDGSQDWTGVVKAPTLNSFSTRALAAR